MNFHDFVLFLCLFSADMEQLDWHKSTEENFEEFRSADGKCSLKYCRQL